MGNLIPTPLDKFVILALSRICGDILQILDALILHLPEWHTYLTNLVLIRVRYIYLKILNPVVALVNLGYLPKGTYAVRRCSIKKIIPAQSHIAVVCCRAYSFAA